MKRQIYFLTIPFFLIGCANQGKIGNIDDFYYSPASILVDCNTKKIKLASTENLDKGLVGMMEGVSKGISTRFVNPEEWNSYSEYSGEKFENLVTSACKK